MMRRFTLKQLNAFARSDSGAATVDWVVMTMASIALCMMAVGAATNGSISLAASIKSSLTGTADLAYRLQRLSVEGAVQWASTFANMTDTQLLAQVPLRHDQFMSHLEAEQWSQAVQRVDYMHLIHEELATRNMSPPSDIPSAAALLQMYTDARNNRV